MCKHTECPYQYCPYHRYFSRELYNSKMESDSVFMEMIIPSEEYGETPESCMSYMDA